METSSPTERERLRRAADHRALDMMVAQFISESPVSATRLPSRTTLMEFMEWSARRSDPERWAKEG